MLYVIVSMLFFFLQNAVQDRRHHIVKAVNPIRNLFPGKNHLQLFFQRVALVISQKNRPLLHFFLTVQQCCLEAVVTADGGRIFSL